MIFISFFFFFFKCLHLRSSNGSKEIVLRGLWDAYHCFLGFPVSHLISSTCSSPLPTSISDAFNSTGAWTYRVFVICMFPYESQPLKATALHAATTYMAASVRTFDLLLRGRKCQEYAKAKLSYLYHITFALWELSVLLLCVCAIALGIGTRTLHDKYSPVTCSWCAVIENMICACTEKWSPTCLCWDSLVCFCCVVHVHRCRKSKGVLALTLHNTLLWHLWSIQSCNV